MLIKNWRDAGIMYEADTSGAGEGEQQNSEGGAMSPEQILAELERTRAALKAANKEAAERRKKLEEIESTEAKRKESELTEVQRAAKRAEEAEASLKQTKERYRTNAIRNEIKLYAQNAGFVDRVDHIQIEITLTVIDTRSVRKNHLQRDDLVRKFRVPDFKPNKVTEIILQ